MRLGLVDDKAGDSSGSVVGTVKINTSFLSSNATTVGTEAKEYLTLAS